MKKVKKWQWVLIFIGLLVIISFLPLWDACTEDGCWKTSFWLSENFVLYD